MTLPSGVQLNHSSWAPDRTVGTDSDRPCLQEVVNRRDVLAANFVTSGVAERERDRQINGWGDHRALDMWLAPGRQWSGKKSIPGHSSESTDYFLEIHPGSRRESDHNYLISSEDFNFLLSRRADRIRGVYAMHADSEDCQFVRISVLAVDEKPGPNAKRLCGTIGENLMQ